MKLMLLSKSKINYFLLIVIFVFAEYSNAQSKSGSPDALKIIPRAEWGARHFRDDISKYESYGLRVPSPNKIILHNSNEGHGTGKKAIQAVQNFHMDRNGWSDVGYNFLIDSSGNVYEGRSLRFVPSHAGRSVEANQNRDITVDPDYGAIGVVMLGRANEPFTKAQEEAAKKLISRLKGEYPSIGKLMTHSEVKHDLIHQGLTPIGDYHDHICPGFAAKKNIANIRAPFQSLTPGIPKPEVKINGYEAAP